MATATPRKLFVNLPVRDLKKSMEFFASLGFTFNPQFTDEKAACMVFSDDAYAMLLQEPFFKTFTTRPIVDARQQTEGIFALSCTSRAEVDEILKKALAAGAHARDAEPGSRVHVQQQLLRPRRAPLGSAVDGSEFRSEVSFRRRAHASACACPANHEGTKNTRVRKNVPSCLRGFLMSWCVVLA